MNTSFERGENNTDEWLTPQHIIEDLGPFDLDPCSPVERPWPTAARHITKAEDGLSQRWEGFCFVNPPYSNAPPWLLKLALHAEGGVALTFARTETRMFFESVWARYSGVLFIKGRLKFCHPDGTPGGTAGAPSVLIGYGEEALRRLARANTYGHLVVASAHILLTSDGKPVLTWRQAIEDALAGRTLTLRDIYTTAEAQNKVRFSKIRGVEWRSKIRKTLQKYFKPIKRGVWAPSYRQTGLLEAGCV